MVAIVSASVPSPSLLVLPLSPLLIWEDIPMSGMSASMKREAGLLAIILCTNANPGPKAVIAKRPGTRPIPIYHHSRHLEDDLDTL